MTRYVGEAVDRLITIEAKNHGMPHGILQPMYDAARKAAGNKPVTMTAAKGLQKHLGKGDVVFIMTGAGTNPPCPKARVTVRRVPPRSPAFSIAAWAPFRSS
jgi:hypothetical protein